MKNAGFVGRRISLIPRLEMARPKRFELLTFWFVGALVDFEVLCFQQVSRPALTRNLHKGAPSGTKCYVFATFPWRMSGADRNFKPSLQASPVRVAGLLKAAPKAQVRLHPTPPAKPRD